MVLPSIYPEGVPRSLLEAAAIGKPIVTTNTAGCSFTVDDGENGFLCHPGSTKDLINKAKLNTVCQSASCPNIGECWDKGHATVMILGDVCTRKCGFCNIKSEIVGKYDLYFL